ncbi:MAG: rhamnulokinase [Actinobacteria bacterium]|nr:rhamnulokinase [Actinomycetota bacterium]
MSVKNFLILDFGASNGRASVASFNGKNFEIDAIHRFENIPVLVTDTLYWDFLKLFSELKTELLLAFKKYNNIESLGIDTWGVDFGLVDKNGKLISNPIHYRDKKRNSVNQEVFKLIPEEELFRLTGCALASYYSIFNMYSLKKENAIEYNNANKFLMIPDLFNYFLTGNAVNEYTDAQTTLMCNPVSKKWEYKIIDRLGFPREIFCNIIQPGTKVGRIQQSVCEELDIKPITVVAPASHDTPSAVAGIPIIDKSRNIMFISIGTWGVNILEMDTPLINLEIYKSGFANEAGAAGKTLLFKNFTGMWLIQQCRERWLNDLQKNISWDDIMVAARDSETTGSLIDVDAQIFIVKQSDIIKTIQKFCKDKKQKIPNNIGQMARLIYESMTLRVKYNMRDLERITGKKFDYIHMVGGGTKDVLFCQWVADATGIPVNTGPTETTSAGNLIMQLKAAGEIDTLEEGRKICLNSSTIKKYLPTNTNYWDDLYQKFLRIF